MTIYLLLFFVLTPLAIAENCGPIIPGTQQDQNCRVTPLLPPSIRRIVAEGSIQTVSCETAATYRATLKITKIKQGPTIHSIDFLFTENGNASVVAGDKGIFTLKRKKENWMLAAKVASVFSSSLLPSCR